MDIVRQVSEALNAITNGELNASVVAPMNVNVEAKIKGKNKVIANVGHSYYICKKMNVWADYSINGLLMEQILSRPGNPSLYTYNICGYIKQFIDFNSNIIKLNKDKVQGYCSKTINPRLYYEAIDYLCAMNIICKTDKQGIYVVNPFCIFKGDMNMFLDIYNKAYEGKEIEIIDNKIKISEIVILRTTNNKDYIPKFISTDKERKKVIESMFK